MTASEINVAIAEACGWKRCRNDGEGNYFDAVDGPFWREPLGRSGRNLQPPNYYEDLNAIHEAEKTIPRTDWYDYTRELRAIVQRDCNTNEHYSLGAERSQLIADIWFYGATAAQRAEALLKTIGKHPENKKEHG